MYLTECGKRTKVVAVFENDFFDYVQLQLENPSRLVPLDGYGIGISDVQFQKQKYPWN